MKHDPVPFLLNAYQPWIRYNTLKNLVTDEVDNESLVKSKKAMLNAPLIKESIEKCQNWGEAVLTRHNDAKHPIHRLEMLVEFGLTREEPGMANIAEGILVHQSPEGAFTSYILVPKSFKGSGKEGWDWMTCDVPILMYFLSNTGYRDDERVGKAVDHLTNLVRDNGLGCHSSIPKFRGPGRKDDHCPYANILALKALFGYSRVGVKEACQQAIQAQLDFWNNRGKRKIFMFGIGTDFQKLRYPNIYYNIIHVLDVLSLFEEAREEPAFNEMLATVNEKQIKDGSFTPESIWMAFKDQDFGQKKIPSPTLTYKIAMINHRCGLLPHQ
ncbi:MAG: hypothetical protein ACXAEU_04940 [Candidatus Hodarchaeales archaeon]